MKLFILKFPIFITTFLICILQFSYELNAESTTGFRKKGIYIEYRYGLTYFHSGSLANRVDDKNKLKIPAYAAEDDALVYSFAQSDANKPYFHSKAHSLLFEYGFTDKIGLGFNFHTERYKANNLSTSNYNQNYLYSAALYGSDIGNPLVLANLNKRYVGVKGESNLLNVVTIDINLAYHFSPGKKWDPYVRAGLGLGTDSYSASNVKRLIGSVGTRYFVNKNFYLVGEFQLAHQEIYKQSKPGFLSSFTPNGVLREAYVQVGVGISPDFKKSEKIIPKKEPEIVPPAKKEVVIEQPPEKEIDTLVPELRKAAKENNLQLAKRDGKLMVISLNEGLFESGSEKISDKGEKSFRNLAKVLTKLRDVNFTIEGHTDNVPIQNKTKFETNKELSLARAESVKEIFMSENIPESKLETKGFGDSRPIKSNATAEGRQANRRIEVITDKNLSEIPQLDGLLDEK